MKTARFEVVVRWPGNVDFGQTTPIAATRVFTADSLTALVATVQHAIHANEAGSGNFAPDAVRRDGVPFCTLSYNGRCWALSPGRSQHHREILPLDVDAQIARDIAFTSTPVCSR